MASETPAAAPNLLSVSLVSYRSDLARLEQTLACLNAAAVHLMATRGVGATPLWIVDNCGHFASTPLPGSTHAIVPRLISGHGNVGFGRGHNLALAEVASRYHLILNPDVEFEPAALAEGLAFLEAHPEVALIVPDVRDAAGARAFLCRNLPSVLDLFLRGFAPRPIRHLFARRLARYELRHAYPRTTPLFDPPVVSGCFMLFRTEVLRRLGGFDPRYFLYFEDYDLARRTHRHGRIALVPHVRIVHHGGGAARKGWRHIRLFAHSAWVYFRTHGWRWL